MRRTTTPFPRTLHACVAPLTAPVLRAHGVDAALLQNWATIAGEEMAAHTSPLEVRFSKGKNTGGVLTLMVDSAYALALQYQTPLLIEKLAVYFGYRAVERIAIRQTRQAAPPRMVPASAPVPVRTGDALTDALNQLASHILKC